MRRAIGNAATSVGGAAALVLALVLLDERVRDRIGLVFDARHPGAALVTLGGRLAEVAAIVAVAAREQSLAHAPLVIFALASTIVFLFMLRA